jgi:hypothetical protein
MACCEVCGHVLGWTYAVCGDGDGIEFLDATARLDDGRSVTTTVMLRT